MKILKPHSLLLALCLGASAPVALAATDMNDQRAPGTQTHEGEHRDAQGGATGSGTPADAMGTGSGGTDSNGTDKTGGDGTTNGSGSGHGGTGNGGPGSGNGGSGSGSGSGS
ncbi:MULTISPECIES: hypothetical protein [unclassified Pseudomonas]|uniref:hypothetical protein n=1 Tax=unclassified Pseudomonas TaxID=196821 RepID=UPI0013024F76|nr:MULTISPECIES: hypothetical protein [unclassified Pseudomonas]